jgi:hypothetical protein
MEANEKVGIIPEADVQDLALNLRLREVEKD